MKIYRGFPDRTVLVQDERGTRPLHHHPRHSPTGFNWGYAGSGPADLARSLLWDLLEVQPAPSLYQDFKFAVIATLQTTEAWKLTEEEIHAWLAARPIPIICPVCKYTDDARRFVAGRCGWCQEASPAGCAALSGKGENIGTAPAPGGSRE